jgi:Lamin Tail Domain
MGLHICQINRFGSDDRGEWVSVANDGSTSVSLTSLEITDVTRSQQHVHVYSFPAARGGGALMLAPGQTAYVFTGSGHNARLPDGDLLLFAGRHASIWNNVGDVAYLRDRRGAFID